MWFLFVLLVLEMGCVICRRHISSCMTCIRGFIIRKVINTTHHSSNETVYDFLEVTNGVFANSMVVDQAYSSVLACVHGSTNGTNGIPISFKVLPMVPLVKPLVPMVVPMVPLGNPEQSPCRVFHVISVQFICYTSRFASKTVPRAPILCILINITDRSMLYYRSLVERQTRGPMVL